MERIKTRVSPIGLLIALLFLENILLLNYAVSINYQQSINRINYLKKYIYNV